MISYRREDSPSRDSQHAIIDINSVCEAATDHKFNARLNRSNPEERDAEEQKTQWLP